MVESNYPLRFLSYLIGVGFKQSTQDYRQFAKQKIVPANTAFKYEKLESQIALPSFSHLIASAKQITSFESFLDASQTCAFIIVKDDKIVYENYSQGHNRESLFQIFSITKSFTSILIGIAVEGGLIKNINDPVTFYLPELKKNGFEKLTINNLLQMHSGIKFKEGFTPWKEMVISYLYQNGRDLTHRMKLEDEIGKFFHYNDYHLILLTAILESVLEKSPIKFFEEKIWKQIGSEYPAYMCLDNSKNGLAKLESGLVCTPIDLAKFGRLLLNNGMLNENQVVPRKWIEESTDFASSNLSKEYFSYYDQKSWGNWFRTGKAAYKNFWWGYKIDESHFDYFAMGILGQILYISPSKNAIGIRLGNAWQIKGWWPSVIKEIIDSL